MVFDYPGTYTKFLDFVLPYVRDEKMGLKGALRAALESLFTGLSIGKGVVVVARD